MILIYVTSLGNLKYDLSHDSCSHTIKPEQMA